MINPIVTSAESLQCLLLTDGRPLFDLEFPQLSTPDDHLALDAYHGIDPLQAAW